MRKKNFENISKIGQNRPFWHISAWPAQASWVAGKKSCQKVGQTCQQSSRVNKIHFYQKSFVSISHMYITDKSSNPFYTSAYQTLRNTSEKDPPKRFFVKKFRDFHERRVYYFILDHIRIKAGLPKHLVGTR